MKKAITIVLLSACFMSLAQTKKDVQSELELQKSKLSLFQQEWVFDQHLLSDNLMRLEQIADKQIEIIKTQTKLKLFGVKKNTSAYSNIISAGDVEIQKVKNHLANNKKELQDKDREQRVKLYELNNPSLIESK
jgi:hypothetical protein